MVKFHIVSDTGKRIKLGKFRITLSILSITFLIVIAIFNEETSRLQTLTNADFSNIKEIEKSMSDAQFNYLLGKVLMNLNPNCDTTLAEMSLYLTNDVRSAYQISEGVVNNSLPFFDSYKNIKTPDLELLVIENEKKISKKVSKNLKTINSYSNWSFRLLIASLILQFLLVFYQQIEDKASN